MSGAMIDFIYSSTYLSLRFDLSGLEYHIILELGSEVDSEIPTKVCSLSAGKISCCEVVIFVKV